MFFAKSFFLIGLLPIYIVIIYLARNRDTARRWIIISGNYLIMTIFGGMPTLVYLTYVSIMTYLFALFISRSRNKRTLSVAIIVVLAPLVSFKYMFFIADAINEYTPLGLSIVSFEAIALLFDYYRNEKFRKPNLLDISAFLSFFPTFTSGPIMRFESFNNGLMRASYEDDRFYHGVERVAVGLCKKILLADKIAPLANYYFDGIAVGKSFSGLGLWMGAIAYTLQLYFDFSGYSDMAIGISAMMGIELDENFDKPYTASSIKDFWRRWHISLSSWFKDYVYIPMGGNRRSKACTVVNLLVVWILTGIWHGLNYKFIVWGLGYFILIVLENNVSFLKHIGTRWYGHLYTLFFVNLLWIPFRADSIMSTVRYLRGMFVFSFGLVSFNEKMWRFIPLTLLCMLLSTDAIEFTRKGIWLQIRRCVLIVVTLLALCSVINSAYVPYIYGKF